MLTPGQSHDLTCAQPLLENADPGALIGDKAYDADTLIDKLNQRSITPVIPPKALVANVGDPAIAGSHTLTVVAIDEEAVRAEIPVADRTRWAKSGVLGRIFKLLASDHDNEYMMIDATIVRAHQYSAGARKKWRASDRQIARRIDHQDPRARRCLG